MPLVLLTSIGFISWLISTLAGGGSPLLLIPLVNFLIGSAGVAPVITTGMLLGNSQRIFLFWRSVNWKVTLWYLPGGMVGAVLGAYAFTQLHLEWLELLVGLSIVLLVIGFALRKQETTWSAKAWYFLPAGFVYALLSGLIGSSGPILNPLYLNYGLVKEEMIATKATNVVVIHVVKMFTYAAFGALTPQYLGYGLAIGLVAAPANLVGKYLLGYLNAQQFRQIVLAVMGISGALMMWTQRGLVGF
ncbi:sulfite exporter TauE/SafE family protein [Oxynema aestuarii]|jgi:uncharacterized membrane protein YfcA|uniref:Probable membrane transporter protein n=1 Tax=Oxynema aestuarii AP17 TaxID=2064643 RepID=A0A6H1TTI4_9CYAN|nr:sulfite exporter TauE/SafE family protein [Oxynema aestuarii]QIZ69526.1 sulfite exporter TauE/SafE family protein [Oxynema aestuarii AP17]RMH76050.1 MAG: sulfite exporter TauE/SafE family protein [Cyanobacteria bacterium J007]